jgi:RHS repeat-associated protein
LVNGVMNEGWSNLTLAYPAPGGTSARPHAVATAYQSSATTCGSPSPWLSLSYDGNGNLAGQGTSAYTFDAENRLKTRSASGGAVSYTYDGNGTMVKRTNADGSWTVYIGGIYEKSFTAGGTVTGSRKYYAALGRTIAVRDVPAGGGAGTLAYLLADHLGSTVEALDASGATLTEQKYWPYGGTRAGGVAQTDKLYTGQQQEPGDAALGLYNYKARFYSTTLGRFVSADPTNGGGLNRYAYTYNNPTGSTDPTGLAAELGGDNPLIQLAAVATWWSAYFGVDPGIVLGLLFWESGKGQLQELYETGGYFAVRIGGEAGLRRYERDARPILAVLIGSTFGPVGRLLGGVAGAVLHFGTKANEVSWGPGNITLSLAQQLEIDNAVLAKSSALATVDALRSTTGAIAYLAAAVKGYGSNLPAGLTGEFRTAHIVVQHNVGETTYRSYVSAGAFPVQDASGGWAATGARDLDGNPIGRAGARYLNNVMPIVDLARSLTLLCTSGRLC